MAFYSTFLVVGCGFDLGSGLVPLWLWVIGVFFCENDEGETKIPRLSLSFFKI
jgi:hypothetical protein